MSTVCPTCRKTAAYCTCRARRVVAVVVLAFALAGCEPGVQTPGPPAPAEQVIEEDDPGWDCRVHGNRQCGPAQTVPVPTPAVQP